MFEGEKDSIGICILDWIAIAFIILGIWNWLN